MRAVFEMPNWHLKSPLPEGIPINIAGPRKKS